MAAFTNAARCGSLVVFWKHVPDRRGRVLVGDDDQSAKVFLDHLLGRIPGGAAFRRPVKASLGRLAEPGRSVTVIVRSKHLVGIVRPTLGSSRPFGKEPFMLATSVGSEYRNAVLLPDLASAVEYAHAQELRRGVGFRWTGFAGETVSSTATRFLGNTVMEDELDRTLPKRLRRPVEVDYSWLPSYIQELAPQAPRPES